MPVTVSFRPDLPPDTVRRLQLIGTPREACGGPWHPAPYSKQAAFLTLDGREGLYGGSAGGGKSNALLMAALQYVCVPGYSALLLRQTYGQLAGEDGLIERLTTWLSPKIATHEVTWSEQRKRFKFASGATIGFGFLATDAHKLRYQGLAYQYTGWDELTHWPNAKGYQFVGFSRTRRPALKCGNCPQQLTRSHPGAPWQHADQASTLCRTPIPSSRPNACPGCGYTAADVPLRTRSGSNPGGPGHGWVRARFLQHGNTPGRFYLPAGLRDNPFLDAATYELSLAELDPVTRLQMLNGDWDVREAGRVFDRAWLVGSAA